MNIYLDIDGVLLANENHLANYADEFVEYLVNHHRVYWLTTHCHGDASVPLARFGRLFSERTRTLLKQIMPTKWEYAKTEAIDFSQPFCWFDDDLYPNERAALVSHNALKNWIEIDLVKDPNALYKYMKI